MPKRPIAVFDIDGTIFRSSLLIEVTNILIDIGAFPRHASRNYEHEYRAWLNREGSYETYLGHVVETFAEHIKGMPVKTVEAISDIVINSLSAQTYQYTRDLIGELRETHFVVAISGSPETLVSRFAQTYEFDAYTATEYFHEAGVYTGEARVGNKDKDETVKTLIEEHGLTLHESIGVGDTESDESFLHLVERAIAFNPNHQLFTAARKHGWEIIVERKDQIYTLLPDEEGSYRLS